ncbi:MAG: DUF1570 domain-containing protein [Phycisphaerae bacterium]|jgi:hypothetical protein|nr:DUF1570 domain-containing protein [Phycisphaerae bacterium]HOO16189.1 DUF1570 domain-containing protein [Phycisphaerae bacterium]HPC21885.1 DUF1570 domain-containing protein [Phycisphaerae bacterium]HRS27728.1 DUF1570 domain-containing protein [Phycisphaerae bacterium]HRT42378.1 DUF1570 domain-containing protein [Phycisphaerae bacterium]
MKHARRWGFGLLIALLLAACVLPEVQAENLGKMRIQQTDGKWVTGDVEETPEAYLVKVGSITVTIPKTRVKAILPVEETQSPGEAQEESKHGSGLKDLEIEKLLEGTGLMPPDEDPDDIELPLDEESVGEMMRIAGTENIYATKHVVVVYTSTKQKAAEIATRLEAIWRWRVRFMKMLNLPLRMPEHKLELYYFADHEEFKTLQVNIGGQPDDGTLGFFSPDSNRSHFFDMLTWRPIKMRLQSLKNAPASVRAREENMARQWAEYQTLSVTQHELGHHIDFNLGLFPQAVFLDMESFDSIPRWLVEGTTMMFEVPPTTEGASLGVINYERVEQFQTNPNFAQKWSPDFFKLFVVRNEIWLQTGWYYPMGWALVYYLWEVKRPGLIEYYHIISSRDPGEAVSYSQREREFQDCFGTIDQKWVDDFWKYIMELPRKRSLLPPKDYP